MPADADLLVLLVAGGVLSPPEAALIPPGSLGRLRHDPYALTVTPWDALPAPALRWRWERERAAEFCGWVREVLRKRFDVALEVMPEPPDDPALLRLRLRDREEVVDWAYLNSARWMGAFCTIAGRLLAQRGVEALELETGDLDAVILFCRSSVSEELRAALPVAE